ncbi:MAG: hypothetical protein U9O24_00565 [Campylobacterota bacterium]|nr:hypothetical protein [Campylobacterota bacterium]
MCSIKFKELEKVDNIKEVVKNLFDVELDVSGGWGYSEESALNIHSLTMPIEQFMNLFATLRANIEMNLTLDKDERYGGITLTLQKRESISRGIKAFTVATFKISAMNEGVYAGFIKEYKENYGEKEFDIAEHFKKRKDNTVVRVVDYWFYEDN